MNLFKRKVKKPTQRIGIIDNSFPFAIREAYKSLYTNIIYSGIDSPCKKLVITSAVPSEGKSTVASNLAYTIAQNSENARVLLIDADMRAPAITDILNLDDSLHGLSEFLAGVDKTPNIIKLDGYEFDVLMAGSRPVNPTQLLASSNLQHLFEMCESNYDYIIIDTPPVNIVTDALLFSKYVSGFVLSVLADYSDRKNLKACIEKIEQIDVKILGFVLSSVAMKSKGGRYDYKYMHRYDS